MNARVGLCMIVRNEAHVIKRCLESVRPFIDHWTIVDTGSTDGTQALIKELLDGIPGFLLEEPWVDFGTNRTSALAAARPHADYSWMIDADEVWAVPDDFAWPELNVDAVSLCHRTAAMTYWRKTLFNNRLEWVYVGVLHEYCHAEGETSQMRLETGEVIGYYDGGRSQGLTTREKYARDAVTLEVACAADPDNRRHQFYLARSYRDSGQDALAEAAFARRAEMGGGFLEEIADSLLEIARYMQGRGAPFDEIQSAYLRAWEFRPWRAEPLAALARFCREQERWALGRMYSAHALSIPVPVEEELWIDGDVYTWRALDEFAVCSSWTWHWAESASACKMLLTGQSLPEDERERVETNLALAGPRLGANDYRVSLLRLAHAPPTRGATN